MNYTFAMIKPDAIKNNNMGEIIHRIEMAGFCIVCMEMRRFTQHTAEEFYAAHKGKDYFENLIRFTISGPVVGMVLHSYDPDASTDTIDRFRTLIGNTYPNKAAVGTLRAEFGKGVPNNAIHGSDSFENYLKEVKIFFKDKEN